MRNRLVNCANILIALAFIAIEINAQAINLQLQNDYTLGTGAATPRFAVGDLNNDGRPDVVGSTGIVGQPVSVLLNNGNGGFNAPIQFGNTLNATAVAIGDFNNDGFADLAIGQPNNTSGVLNIRLGNGTGNFPNETNTGVVQNVTDIVAADFNGDGNVDLAMTNILGYSTPPTNAVRIMLGNGSGGFGTPTGFAVGSAPLDIEVADLNADGRPDLAVSAFTTTNTLTILLNNGTGGFTPAPAFSWPNASNAAKVVAGDFNRDCMTDLAVIRTDSIAILTGNNAGGFSLSSIAVTNSPVSLAVGDFNLDRKVDLAVGRFTGFVIFPGNGSGSFDTGGAYILGATAITDQIALLDVNRDGRMDLALSRRSNSFSLYNDVSNYFLRTADDYDLDGKADLAVFRPSDGNWYINQTTQGFKAVHWGISTDMPAAADYDGDLKADIAVWRGNGFGDPDRAYLFIFRSSNGTVQQEQFGRQGDTPVAGDWDGDGHADAAVYRNGTAPGDQSFFFYRPSASPGVDFRPVFWGISGDAPVRGDFDGDARLDAAVFRASDATWYIMQSSNSQPLYQNWGFATDLQVPSDYDGDGMTDFAVFRPSTGIWYLRNSSNGILSVRHWGTTGDSLTPGDYNGDGKSDVAVYRPSDQRWHVPPCATYGGIDRKFGTSGDIAVQAAP